MAIKTVVLTERISGKRVKDGMPKIMERYDNPNAIKVTVEINGDYDEDEVKEALFKLLEDVREIFGDYPEY